MFLLKSSISDSSSLFRSFNVYHLVFFKGVEFLRFSVIPAQVFFASHPGSLLRYQRTMEYYPQQSLRYPLGSEKYKMIGLSHFLKINMNRFIRSFEKWPKTCFAPIALNGTFQGLQFFTQPENFKILTLTKVPFGAMDIFSIKGPRNIMKS